MADNKKEKIGVLSLHCGIYLLVFAIVNAVFVELKLAILATVIIAVSHLVIDFIKTKIDKEYKKYSVWFYTFMFDQILHLGIITVTYKFLNLAQNTTAIYSKCLSFDKFEDTIEFSDKD